MKGNSVEEAEDRRPLLPQPGAKAIEEDGECYSFWYFNKILAQYTSTKNNLSLMYEGYYRSVC